VSRLLSRWLLGALGFVLIVIGAVKAADVATAAAAIALLAGGVLLLISAFVLHRVERFSVSSSGLEFRLIQEISALGAEKTALVLQRTDLAGFADAYALIHEELRDPAYTAARVHLQDLLVNRSAGVARREKFDDVEVRKLFRDGAPMMRVLALGLMRGDLALADGSTVLAAITDSRTGNEQYQGLLLALDLWRRLPAPDRRAVHAAVAGNPDIAADPDRRHAADRLLALPVSDGAGHSARSGS
jgi:hypothetical protein